MHMHMCMHICMHMHMHMHMFMHMYVHVHVMCIYVHAYVHMHMHIHWLAGPPEWLRHLQFIPTPSHPEGPPSLSYSRALGLRTGRSLPMGFWGWGGEQRLPQWKLASQAPQRHLGGWPEQECGLRCT
jgi:hypothetical protein